MPSRERTRRSTLQGGAGGRPARRLEPGTVGGLRASPADSCRYGGTLIRNQCSAHRVSGFYTITSTAEHTLELVVWFTSGSLGPEQTRHQERDKRGTS